MKKTIFTSFILLGALLFSVSLDTHEPATLTNAKAEFILDDNVALAEGSTCVCMPSPYSVCIGYGGVVLYNMKLVCR